MALAAQQQVKIWKTGQLSRHYIAEISLNVTLIKPQSTNNNNLINKKLTNQPLNIFYKQTEDILIWS